jgi:hypothetical protein
MDCHHALPEQRLDVVALYTELHGRREPMVTKKLAGNSNRRQPDKSRNQGGDVEKPDDRERQTTSTDPATGQAIRARGAYEAGRVSTPSPGAGQIMVTEGPRPSGRSGASSRVQPIARGGDPQDPHPGDPGSPRPELDHTLGCADPGVQDGQHRAARECP